MKVNKPAFYTIFQLISFCFTGVYFYLSLRTFYSAGSPYDLYVWLFEMVIGALWLFISINLLIGNIAFLQFTRRVIVVSILVIIGLVAVFAFYIVLLIISGDSYAREIAILAAFTFAIPVSIVLFIVIAPLVMVYIAAGTTGSSEAQKKEISIMDVIQ